MIRRAHYGNGGDAGEELTPKEVNEKLRLAMSSPLSINRLTHTSWDFLKTFGTRQVPLERSWRPVELIQAQARKVIAPSNRQLTRLFSRWEQRLKAFGGDPSSLAVAYSDFRPLRLSREEDWSDWLAELLKGSDTGILAETMFSPHVNCGAGMFRRPSVVREPGTEDQERRGDIKVKCQSRLVVNLEVKVGDKNFDKTYETSRRLRAQEPTCIWHDLILMPEESVTAWDTVAKEHNDEPPVGVVLWSDVVRGLRRCLWERKESFVWRAWAWTFCGAIERVILKLPPPNPHRPNLSQLQVTLRWLKLLEIERGE